MNVNFIAQLTILQSETVLADGNTIKPQAIKRLVK